MSFDHCACVLTLATTHAYHSENIPQVKPFFPKSTVLHLTF